MDEKEKYGRWKVCKQRLFSSVVVVFVRFKTKPVGLEFLLLFYQEKK